MHHSQSNLPKSELHRTILNALQIGFSSNILFVDTIYEGCEGESAVFLVRRQSAEQLPSNLLFGLITLTAMDKGTGLGDARGRKEGTED